MVSIGTRQVAAPVLLPQPVRRAGTKKQGATKVAPCQGKKPDGGENVRPAKGIRHEATLPDAHHPFPGGIGARIAPGVDVGMAKSYEADR